MKIGIVGLPEAGKKTLFELLTGRTVPHGVKEGESVEGIAAVRDPRVDVLSGLFQPERTRSAETQLVLCPDVTAGTGKREWLEAARKCDLLCMVVRAFTAPEVYHAAGSVDAERDRRDLEAELVLADLELVEKRLARIGKEKRGGHTAVQALQEKVLVRCREALEGGKRLIDAVPLDDHERQTIVSLGLVSFVPWLWTFNVDEGDLRSPRWQGSDVFVMSARIEQEIMGLEDAEERAAYLHEVGLESSGLDRLNRAAYDLLGLMSFYTVGKDEVRAWTVRKGARAPEAAGKVHSDMERGFIRVEVTKFDDLVAAGSEEAVRKAGKEQVKGRDYVIQDGEICHFRFNV